jgi:CRP-like cAMP-binding protein
MLLKVFIVMKKGEIGECMFIIMSGEVGIYLEDHGDETATAVVGPG